MASFFEFTIAENYIMRNNDGTISIWDDDSSCSGYPTSNSLGSRTFVSLSRNGTVLFEYSSSFKIYVSGDEAISESEYDQLEDGAKGGYTCYRAYWGVDKKDDDYSFIDYSDSSVASVARSSNTGNQWGGEGDDYVLTSTSIGEGDNLVTHYSADFACGTAQYEYAAIPAENRPYTYADGIQIKFVPDDAEPSFSVFNTDGITVFFGWFYIGLFPDGRIEGYYYKPRRFGKVYTDTSSYYSKYYVDGKSAPTYLEENCVRYDIVNRWYDTVGGSDVLNHNAYSLEPDQECPECFYPSCVGFLNFNMTLRGHDPYEVPTLIPNITKIYDATGWGFPNSWCPIYKDFMANDGTSVPVIITYSPSYTPKDVSGEGAYKITATFEISNDPAYSNYHLDEETQTFTAAITPCPITFPCIFGDDVVQEKVYDGQSFSLPTTDSIVTFQTINENTGEVVDEEVVTLQIVYDPDISDQTGVFGPVRVTARYEGKDAYPNYDITAPGECFATFEITCRPLTVDISNLSFPDVTEYFDSCGTLKVPVGTNITSEVRGMDTEDLIGNIVEGEDVPVTLTATVGHFEGWSYPFNPTTDYRVAYGILLSFEHSDGNYCDIPDKLYVYRAVNASCWVEIEPFGAEWYNSKYNGPVTIPESYISANGTLSTRDVYYPESFTFVIKCKQYNRPDTIVWDDSEVVHNTAGLPYINNLTFIKSVPENCYDADCYYSFKINTSPRSEGGHLIAHSLKCHWLNGKIRDDYVNIDGDFIPRFRFSEDGNSAYLEPFTLTDHLGHVAPVLGIGYLNQQSSFYDADYDGREHCPVVYPWLTAERYIYLSGDTGTRIDIDEEAYWCWIDDEWVANYKIKDAGVYPINRFQQNATDNTEITGGNPHWIGIYGDGTATIHKITLTISPFKITKKWDGGTEIEVDVPPLNISGWAYGDSSCQVIAHGTFPSSDIGEYLVAENNGVDVSFGVSCSPSNYVIEPAVFDGEIIPSALLFDLFFVDEEGNADVTVVCEGDACSTVYDAKTHYVTVKVKEFEEGELSPGMVEWINGVTIEADKLLWTVNEGEEEETVEGEEKVGKLHAGTYLISGYMDFGGSYDLIGQVTFTIGRRPLYLENLTVSYS